jgi:hypothetical protein
MEKIKLVEIKLKFEKALFNWCFVPGFVIMKEKVQDLTKQKTIVKNPRNARTRRERRKSVLSRQ